MNPIYAGSGMLPFLDAIVAYEKELAARSAKTIRVMAVDPGKVTGVTVLWFEAKTGEIVGWGTTLITHDEIRQVMDLMACLRTLADRGRVFIVIENFIVDQVNMNADFLSPVRIGRQFEFGAWLMASGELGVGPVFGAVETPVAWQSRARKADYSDARLKALGFYVPGPDHRRDSTRHALVRWKQLKLCPSFDVPEIPEHDWPDGTQHSAAPGRIERRFNGVPVNTKGQRAVTKQDMERITMVKPNGEREWFPTKNGFAREYDPRSEIGTVPMSEEGMAIVDKIASQKAAKSAPKRKKRVMRRLA